MTTGDGIFLSAVLLSIIALYAATRNRWNWRRVAKWGLGIPFIGVATVGLCIWIYSTYDGRPTAQDEFEGVKLTATPADIRFLKGDPIPKLSVVDRWVYDAHSGSAQPEDAILVVQFRDGRVRYIMYLATERQIVNPYLLGFTIGAHYEEVVKTLGNPSHTSTSADGLSRVLSFDKYRVFFEFERGKVRDYGIFDPSKGPVIFSNEAEAPTSAPR